MFNGKTIASTEIVSLLENNEIDGIKFHFTDGSNLYVEMALDTLVFSQFNNDSKRVSYIHPSNLID